MDDFSWIYKKQRQWTERRLSTSTHKAIHIVVFVLLFTEATPKLENKMTVALELLVISQNKTKRQLSLGEYES